MPGLKRRKVDMVVLGVGAIGFAVVGGVGAAIGDTERVAAIWTTATIAADGSAEIVEVVDYDFGSSSRHGIFRDVPGLDELAPIVVSSPSAPDEVFVSGSGFETRIRIGDSSRTIRGRHRYRIGYPLPSLVTDGDVAWDVVGTSWEVPVAEVEAHVVTPFELIDPICVSGSFGDTTPCAVEVEAPGHLVLRFDGLARGEGVTLYAGIGAALDASPPAPSEPTGRPSEPGSGILVPMLLGLWGALAAASVLSVLVRRAGKERVATGGAADAAFASARARAGLGEERIDLAELAALSTIEFAPPPELTPSQGGLLLAETVAPVHKVAWLVGAANEGYLDLEGAGKDITLVRRDRHDGPAALILDTAFAGRDQLPLGKYDPAFAAAWTSLDAELQGWRRGSSLWDLGAERRLVRVRVLGILAALLGAVAAGIAAAFANRSGGFWLVLVVLGAAVGGAGFSAALRAWELRVRTPAGSAMWLRVESFRRFLSESEAYHADEAAKRGVLRQYTAWAVAVGEIDHWSQAVARSGAIVDPVAANYALIAPSLARMTSTTSVKPSSSGGGGGGGGVGGGGGGGGGGSW